MLRVYQIDMSHFKCFFQLNDLWNPAVISSEEAPSLLSTGTFQLGVNSVSNEWCGIIRSRFDD